MLAAKVLEGIKFYKYHGTGNDFILIDNRNGQWGVQTEELIAHLCHRRFGIGADGLITLENSNTSDFGMKYYNADGVEGSMCGNGGRCIVAFAHFLGIIANESKFEAIDGLHEAKLLYRNLNIAGVSLKMKDVDTVQHEDNTYLLDTGSPHYVEFRPDVSKIDIISEGKKIRYSDRFIKDGINVNYVDHNNQSFSIRTYERGVEDETFSCGTGTVAAAIAVELKGLSGGRNPVKFKTKGGNLEVSFTRNGRNFSDVWLTGDTVRVFEGMIEV